MRRCRTLLGVLFTALSAFLALAVATGSAVAHPGDPTSAATIPYAAAAAAPASFGAPAAAGQGHGASNVEQDRNPGPFDDCRHRRAIRASVAAPLPQPCAACAACAAPGPVAHPAGTPRTATGHAAVAAVLDPGERPALLQVFRC
ncbi:hypothetical protein RCO28_10945 [Streptomyces sp. LHD-70]|uniref:hypothetical protein n=1 Tax=Streptomyces sp. LHD-70 TaxID=3072140 RepID=UPI00280CD114|nr:hypothetical protein [Streptomyces sp. LHD-70]MDQ8703001.1 hypothetical protein [Streptomyces sp. LHD-70]